MTLFRAALAAAVSRADVPAFVMPAREIGFAEFAASVDACAAWLARAGCTPDGIVGLSIADEVAHLTVSLGLLALGVPQVILPTHDPAPMRADVARRLDVRRVVVARVGDALAGRDALLLVPDALDPHQGAPVAQPLPRRGPVRDFTFASSGTTGRAKLFGWDQLSMAVRTANIAASERSDAHQRLVHASGVEHRPAQVRRLGLVLLGRTSVLQSPDHPLSLGALCARFRVTEVEASPLQVRALLHDDAATLPAATTVYASGARVASSLRRAFRTRFERPLFVHYGASEIGRISSTYPDGDGDDDEGVGRILPSIAWRIVDDDGRALRLGEVGTLHLRTARMADGYVDDPVATARHFRDGWFVPGDLARVDGDGRLHLAGRADEMINLHGIKVFPAEIERMLESMPGVRAAAAFAQPSEVHGQIPLAAVELDTPRVCDADTLLAAARAALGVRAPRRILVVDALPRNAAGKVVHARLIGLVSRAP